jgi:hypothetical protein
LLQTKPHSDVGIQRAKRLALYRLAGVVLGLCLSLVWVGLSFTDKKTKFEDLALAKGSVDLFDSYKGQKVHCTDFSEPNAEISRCLQGAQGNGNVILWFGNSQLHVINEYQKGESTATGLLHERLSPDGWYLMTVSQPNANLQEHLMLLAYLLPRVKPRMLLLPVVLDDFRENGIRDSLLTGLDDPAVIRSLSQSDIGSRLLHGRQESAKHGSEGGDMGALHNTLQERSEKLLTEWLDRHWKLWDARSEARGQIMNELYILRNLAFGINPTTTRRMIPSRFADNWAAMDATVNIAEANGVTTYLYIPPLRNDLVRPYDPKEYADFKARLFREFANRPNVVVSDLELVVPDKYWGVRGLLPNGQPMVDFMHFTAEGHHYFADGIYQMIKDGLAKKP